MMKTISKHCRRLKDFIATIAQILLAVLILPMLSFFLLQIAPDSSSNFIMGLIQAVPIFDVWTDILEKTISSLQIPDAATFLNTVIESVNMVILEAEIMGMCIYFCKTVGIKLNIRGVPIIQTIVGVFLACFLIKSIKANGSETYMMTVFLFMLLANILLTLFVADGILWKKIIAIIIGLACSAFIAGLSIPYITVNVMIIQGWITDFDYAIQLLAVTVFPLFLFLLIDYFFLTPLAKD